VCVAVGVELLLMLNYCCRGSRHVWVVVCAGMLLLSMYCGGNKHACVIVCVEMLLSLS